jgi:large subunit ribosomal protein L14e
MDNEILLGIGRVVYINYGPLSGKLAVCTDIVNGNKVVVDGPGLGVDKQVISVKRLSLTKFKLGGYTKGAKRGELQKQIEEFNVQEKFDNCGIGKRISKQKKRAQLSDFDRFKVMVLKRQVGNKVRAHVNKNRKAVLAQAK